MQQDNIEQAMQLSSNPFIAQKQRREARYNQWGLDEFENILDRQSIRSEAEQRIYNENITDDAEKRRVYDEVKAQYREYLAYNKVQRTTSERTKKTIEDDDAEFQRGYDACLRFFKLQEEQQKTKYQQGWNAAWEKSYDRDILNIRAEIEAEDEQCNTSPSIDSLENNAIQQLKDEIKRFDERLKKLERYTEE